MIFATVPLDEAEGTILAHSVQVADGRLPKGTVLGLEHLAALRAAGRLEITAARLEAGDIEENAAALRLAHALCPIPEALGVRLTAAGAGRVNIYALTPGIVEIDEGRINRLNAVDPMITIATLAPFMRVDPGTMVATIKIISYGVPEAALAQATEHVSGAIKVLPPVHASATLIETRISEQPPGPKGRQVTEERLARFRVPLSERCVVPHKSDVLAEAIGNAPGEMILILTASATSDIKDVAPVALARAGGQVAAFGMPVDPGNLLFFGKFRDKPVIGLPGCARSPALNGADWVLERLVCGVALDQGDIHAMGVGGLLKEIPSRPRPRASRG